MLEGAPQGGAELGSPGENLSELLQAGGLGDYAQEAILDRGVRGKSELFGDFGIEAGFGDMGRDEGHGVMDQGPPVAVGVGYKGLNRQQAGDPASDLFAGGSHVEAASAVRNPSSSETERSG